MSHHVAHSGYRQLVRRLNLFPQGAPPSALLFRILSILLSEKEAEFVSRLPLTPFTVQRATKALGLPETEVRVVLDELAGRAFLLDLEHDGEMIYLLPPPMAGFLEFSLMRVRSDIDQQALSGLLYEYLNVEEDFICELFTRGETQLGRTLVHEPSLSAENAAQVLDYERASEVIRSAGRIGVGICYCRHKMSHMGRCCEAPLELCLVFNDAADSLIRHGHVRAIDPLEGLDLLQLAHDHSLLQFADNVRNGVNFICNCCRCCCEGFWAARRFGHLHPVHTTNFMPVSENGRCNGCGRCLAICPMEAITVSATEDEQLQGAKNRASFDQELCLGCGLCVRACPHKAIRLKSREKRVITPVNSAHRIVLMAIERGCLQNLIFDNQAHASHRVMAAILGVILKLPPLKQLMASRQMKSRYLDRLLAKVDTASAAR